MFRSVANYLRWVMLTSVLALLVLVGALISGCGGGGGGGVPAGNGSGGGSSSGSSGGPPPVGNPNLATITGQVTDIAGNPVAGAAISIVGTNLTGSSASDGSFTIYNVPLTATQFTVTPPSGYYSFDVRYLGNDYNLQKPCPLPLPNPLQKGADPLPGPVQLYPTSGPPPAPTYGCP
ncbi:Carboxypeptidase regulatory-like domain [Chthonomonas calidirosea]|uniref:Carboxypeptidase regulatory-like domain n=1 Tax=Chthonomonas calidirosea (strain DSM 23976 / ICMP 18418 / T49) TaxID=1303518 RepID=S0EYJ0_CHTCT|nr:carboxypeptidase-like regulatory domain-containing protein [Chthonomonas calidirosea]CCW35428.1 Carboxypeptidase regulatory-like domain [Chthonomonas calidirosea T49]CEK20307.1 Carboxypeptidase regulatory-like domain [Chthonomonas calidirosea]